MARMEGKARVGWGQAEETRGRNHDVAESPSRRVPEERFRLELEKPTWELRGVKGRPWAGGWAHPVGLAEQEFSGRHIRMASVCGHALVHSTD